VQPGKKLRRVIYPGTRNVGHAWAYLPDFAETIAQLVDREAELAQFECFHFRGHYFEHGVAIAECAGIVANGQKGAPVYDFPWFVVLALSPFVQLFREMAEMRYLWRQSVELDNSKLVAFLGREPHTPIDAALHETLSALGCLQNQDAAIRRRPVRPAVV
jgi:nucleoside-diphosphate-sugar epimerase